MAMRCGAQIWLVATLLVAACLGCGDGSADLVGPTDPRSTLFVHSLPVAGVITTTQAGQIALAVVPGEVMSAERDLELSGRTVVDATIRTAADRARAVDVDGTTGKITEIKEKTAEPVTGAIIEPGLTADDDDHPCWRRAGARPRPPWRPHRVEYPRMRAIVHPDGWRGRDVDVACAAPRSLDPSSVPAVRTRSSRVCSALFFDEV